MTEATIINGVEQEDVPDSDFSSREQKKQELLGVLPPEKHEEISIWFEQHKGEVDDDIFLEAFSELRSAVDYFLESFGRVQEFFQKNDISTEVAEFFSRAFFAKCDLTLGRREVVEDAEKEFSGHWDDFLKTRQKIIESTETEFDFQQWLREKLKKQDVSLTGLLEMLWEKHHSLQEKIRETESAKNNLRGQIQRGLFNETDEKKWHDRIDAVRGDGVVKLKKQLDQVMKKREQRVREQFAEISTNLDDPRAARMKMRQLRRRYGWRVFSFLDAEEFWQRINKIALLQDKISELQKQEKRFKKEKQDAEKKMTDVREKQHHLEDELAILTGKPVKKKSAAEGDVVPEKNEEIETKIQALEKLKFILYQWFQGAQKCLAPTPEAHNLGDSTPEEVFSEAEKYAWLGASDSKISYLKKTRDPQSGENRFSMYERMNRASAYTWPPEKEATLDAFCPRSVIFNYSNFTPENARDMLARITKMEKEPAEMVFLAGQFLVDQYKNKKTPPSAPKEVLEKCEVLLGELQASRHRAEDKL